MIEPRSITVLTDLGLPEELESPTFRNQFFRSERELEIPAQIKNLRKLRGLNQAQLAEMARTKQSAISRLERAQEAKWELETLVRLAEALDARLAVVIEPYEAVIARYKAEQTNPDESAATAVDSRRRSYVGESAATAGAEDLVNAKASKLNAAGRYRNEQNYISDSGI